jgi:hypothetical protein
MFWALINRGYGIWSVTVSSLPAHFTLPTGWNIKKEPVMRELIDLLLIVALVLVVSNPGEDLHRTAVCESVAAAQGNSRMWEKVTADLLGKGRVGPLSYNNYYLFSTTTREGTTVSVGALSHVWKLR